MDPRLVRAFEKGESVDFDEVMGMDAPSGAPASSADGGDDSSNGSGRRPPRVKVSPFTSSARIEEKMLEDEHDRIAKLEEAVRELLDLCARCVRARALVRSFVSLK
jgi:hypothetical protein